MAVVAAAAMAADRRLVNALQERGATSPATAMPIDTASGFERRRLARLERHGLVHRVDNGSFYLDATAWEAYQARVRTVRNVMLVVVLVGLVALIIMSTRTNS